MKRREFLIGFGSVVIAIPATTAFLGCGGGTSDGGGGGTTPTPSGTQDLVVTSSVTQDHTHQVTIPGSALASPPQDGVTEDTTVVLGHQHRITLSSADLTAIAGGQSITRTTTTANGHTHNFTFMRSGGTGGGGGGGGGGGY